MLNDPGLGGSFNEEAEESENSVDERLVDRSACEDRLGWYQCHGNKHAHCCRDGCLNNPDKADGICGPDKCNCQGSKLQ